MHQRSPGLLVRGDSLYLPSFIYSKLGFGGISKSICKSVSIFLQQGRGIISFMTAIKTMIKDLITVPLDVHVDDRGYVIELVRATDPYLKKFGQVYVASSTTKGTIRAFHKHNKLWDYFFIGSGSAKFAFYDDRKQSVTYQKMDTVILTQRNPSLIVVPPGIFHGWMALEENTLLISTASDVYNRKKPDEIRVPYNSFGYDWRIKFK